MLGLVLLASYPKSGNTWFRAVLASIRANGAHIDINKIGLPNCADRKAFDDTLGINSSDLTRDEVSHLRPLVYEFALRKLGDDLFMKVHDAWLPTFPEGVIPFPEFLVKRVLYIVRDPRDVAISLANHTGQSIDRTIRQMNRPNFAFSNNPRLLRVQIPQLLSTWSEHARSWLGAKNLNVQVLRYEDMLENPFEHFRRAIDHIGIFVTDQILREAIHATRFEKMRAQEREKGFKEKPPKSSAFFRRGEANGWRDTLSSQQADQIVADHSVMMRQLGYIGEFKNMNGCMQLQT